MAQESAPSTIDESEIARFDALAETWWDPEGPMKPLHRIQPARLTFIRDQGTAHFLRDRRSPRLFTGLAALDVGCGGGLLCEPLARLGADVTGIDAAPNNIAVAARHAAMMDLDITYETATAEDYAARGNAFDIVLALEIVEHVGDVPAFLAALSTLVRPGGILIMSTINRTAKAFLLAIVGGEYVLRWLPRGTHDWHRFVTPDELGRGLEDAGLAVIDRAGLTYTPLSGEWRLSDDTTVNYLISAAKPG